MTQGVRSRTSLLVALGVLAVPVVLVLGYVAWLRASGTPFIDEWNCAEGAAPVLYDEGGSGCRKEGARLRDNERWDPLGRRPLECHGRRGWTRIAPDGSADVPAVSSDCLKQGAPMPPGWHALDSGR